jgi:hypothetical protein
MNYLEGVMSTMSTVVEELQEQVLNLEEKQDDIKETMTRIEYNVRCISVALINSKLDSDYINDKINETIQLSKKYE